MTAGSDFIIKDHNYGKVGVGLRHTHFPYLENHPPTRIDWFEAISENYMDSRGRPLEMLEKVRKDYPLALHGVSLNIAGFGNDQGLSDEYLKSLRSLIDRLQPFLVSDHLCWTGSQAHGNLHDLLPLPYTSEALKRVSDNILRLQDELKRPMAFENVSTYLRFRHSEMSEWDFIAALVAKTQCLLLLDVNNIYVNSVNHGFDARTFIDAIPAQAVAQIHLAGHSDYGNYLFDTHSAAVSREVWQLYQYALKKLPRHVPTLIEWDEDIPAFERLEDEAAQARKIWSQVHESQ